ncbi:hypothetical protein ACFFRR_011608 [Megaselia abdita]
MTSCKVQECCCISLKIGTVLIGVAGLLVSAIFIIVSCFSTDLEFKLEHILGVPIALVYFFISVLLLYGVFEKSSKCVLPWNVVNFLVLIALLVLGIIAIISIFLDNGFEEGFYLIITPTFLILSAFSIIAYILFVYFWFVTKSFQQELRREEQPYGIN